MATASVSEQVAIDSTLAPVRGIIATHNARGQAYSLTDLKKWVRLSVSIFKVEKIDVFVEGDGARLLPELLDFADIERVRLSLRAAPPLGPESVPAALLERCLDVFLCPRDLCGAWVANWFEAAAAAGIQARVQVQLPCAGAENIAQAAESIQGAFSVNVTYADPFSGPKTRTAPADAPTLVRQLNELAAALADRGTETHLLHVPFCHVAGKNLPLAVNAPRFFSDHQHYQNRAYEFALKLRACGPKWMGKAVENELARDTSVHNAIDRRLLPWILEHPRVYIRVWMIHKLTRHLRFLRGGEHPLPETQAAVDAEVARLRRKSMRQMAPACAECRFRLVCDHDSEQFKLHFPGLKVKTVPGEPVASPMHWVDASVRRLDAVDAERLKMPERLRLLAEEAARVTLREPHTREITADSYDIEGRWTHHMPGAVRWAAFGKQELRSTVLTRIEPPFTMTLTFGGGIAEQIGFAFGRHAKIMCPMIDYTHRLTLHVDADGHYALLRDNVLVRPTEFEEERRLPVRLAGCLEPRIAVRNIDGFIISQTLLLWERGSNAEADRQRLKYSVIIVNSRYARRLQAALLALAHQKDFDLNHLEVVVAYIPGLDTTDDLIDSLRSAHPELRIIRAPFSPDNIRSKGFMINECVNIASGEWIVLLDADILLPPDFFATVDRIENGCTFIAPDGRKMLTPETTARVLLGDVRPWECYEQLAQSEGDYRFREATRVPIGFCQCVRREVFDKVRYHELDHFEGSDWLFGRGVQYVFGVEKRLEGVVVLHLDHAGSQWYGAPKQM